MVVHKTIGGFIGGIFGGGGGSSTPKSPDATQGSQGGGLAGAFTSASGDEDEDEITSIRGKVLYNQNDGTYWIVGSPRAIGGRDANGRLSQGFTITNQATGETSAIGKGTYVTSFGHMVTIDGQGNVTESRKLGVTEMNKIGLSLGSAPGGIAGVQAAEQGGPSGPSGPSGPQLGSAANPSISGSFYIPNALDYLDRFLATLNTAVGLAQIPHNEAVDLFNAEAQKIMLELEANIANAQFVETKEQQRIDIETVNVDRDISVATLRQRAGESFVQDFLPQVVPGNPDFLNLPIVGNVFGTNGTVPLSKFNPDVIYNINGLNQVPHVLPSTDPAPSVPVPQDSDFPDIPLTDISQFPDLSKIFGGLVGNLP